MGTHGTPALQGAGCPALPLGAPAHGGLDTAGAGS